MISLDEAMLYAPVEWHDCSEGYTDIRYHKSTDGIAKITINRPQVRNAFRPLTVKEMIQALADARYDDNIGVIVLTGEGEKAFCAAATRKSAATTAAIRTTPAFIILTCSTSSVRSAPVQNRWSRWWPATLSAAVTCCI